MNHYSDLRSVSIMITEHLINRDQISFYLGSLPQGGSSPEGNYLRLLNNLLQLLNQTEYILMRIPHFTCTVFEL